MQEKYSVSDIHLISLTRISRSVIIQHSTELKQKTSCTSRSPETQSSGRPGSYWITWGPGNAKAGRKFRRVHFPTYRHALGVVPIPY